jgi:hypothetical protein
MRENLQDPRVGRERMTLREQLYKFDDLDIHASIQMQKTIEYRKLGMSKDQEFLKLNEKVSKAILDELDQIYDDLDRHVSAIIRHQEYEKELKNREASASHFPQELT